MHVFSHSYPLVLKVQVAIAIAIYLEPHNLNTAMLNWWYTQCQKPLLLCCCPS